MGKEDVLSGYVANWLFWITLLILSVIGIRVWIWLLWIVVGVVLLIGCIVFLDLIWPRVQIFFGKSFASYELRTRYAGGFESIMLKEQVPIQIKESPRNSHNGRRRLELQIPEPGKVCDVWYRNTKLVFEKDFTSAWEQLGEPTVIAIDLKSNVRLHDRHLTLLRL